MHQRGGMRQPNIPGECATYSNQITAVTVTVIGGEGFEAATPTRPSRVHLDRRRLASGNPPTVRAAGTTWIVSKAGVQRSSDVCMRRAMRYISPVVWSAVGLACKTTVDCGVGYDCATNPDCKLNLATTPDCPTGGTCKLKELGRCWGNTDCGQDEYCKGLVYAPPTGSSIPTHRPVPSDTPGLLRQLHLVSAWATLSRRLRRRGAPMSPRSVSLVPNSLRTTPALSTMTWTSTPPRTQCVHALAGCDSPPTPGQCELLQP